MSLAVKQPKGTRPTRMRSEGSFTAPGALPCPSGASVPMSALRQLFPKRVPSSYISLVTVLDVIQRSSEFLTRKGVESPRLQVELMLAHVLQLPRLKLYLNFDQPVSETQLSQVRAMVKRRGEREPL